MTSLLANETSILNVLKVTPQEKAAVRAAHNARPGADGARRMENACGAGGVLALVDHHYLSFTETDQCILRVPRVRDRVHVDGHDGVFFVIYVDRVRKMVDVVSSARVGDLLEHLPFSAIHPVENRPQNGKTPARKPAKK
ncbi:MAG TPA: hypothetical protein VG225_07600 [Terracidiphilus sp.]|jgi:hypothetical protein|nr:hypothetical protein [Terracidiphilus sp.]